MQRDIKFRAWIKNENRMETCICVSPFSVGDCDRFYWKHDDVILEQYTGLKDKNGKEIYEGDIIGSTDGHDGEYSSEDYIVGEVLWEDETLSWAVTNRIEAESYEILAYDNESLEVLGNIHDNPELLK